jgi:hypothetical protein
MARHAPHVESINHTAGSGRIFAAQLTKKASCMIGDRSSDWRWRKMRGEYVLTTSNCIAHAGRLGRPIEWLGAAQAYHDRKCCAACVQFSDVTLGFLRERVFRESGPA